MERLTGKVALVSGGARGMGASHARAIVAEGGRVAIADLLEAEGQALAEELGDAAIFVRLDVTDTKSWQDAVDATVAAFGSLSVLVNNAGILNFGTTEECTDEDWDRSTSINLTGAFKGMRAAIPALRASAPSSIVNISSIGGIKGMPGIVAYITAKFGIRGMTKTAAVELAKDGIRVNSVAPGNIETPMTDGLHEDLTFPAVPMHRMGLPREISSCVVFLASDESSFTTGIELVADGGELAGFPVQLG